MQSEARLQEKGDLHVWGFADTGHMKPEPPYLRRGLLGAGDGLESHRASRGAASTCPRTWGHLAPRSHGTQLSVLFLPRAW